MFQAMSYLFLAVGFPFVAQVAAEPGRVGPSLLEAREHELTNLLQERLQTFQGDKAAGKVHSFFLGKGSNEDAQPVTTTTDQALNIPAATDQISPQFWNNAAKLINAAGVSTPMPSAAFINAAPKPPAPRTWEAIMQDAQQPLDTKLGGAVMYGLSGPVTPTPPPQQAAISQQFVAQCPMMLFEKNLSIRAASCNETLGKWLDPNPLNPRSVLRWHPKPASGIYFGVDSALTGPGSAMFADLTQVLTLTGYHFVLKNCLGIERWRIEENVYKVDSMGQVSSTVELHDITMNSEAFFIKYLIRSPTGVLMAESNLFRMMTNQVNFTEWKNGENTGKVLAVATRLGQWTKKGWQACMSPTSPRGWSLYFPGDQKDHPSVATVQDIRVAIAGTITLMGYRNENRGKDGLNTQGASRQMFVFVGGVMLVLITCVFMVNFCMVVKASGIKEKLKKTFFDAEGLMPKRPHQERAAPMHPSY